MVTDNEAVLFKNDENEQIKPIIVKSKRKSIAFKIIKRTIDILAGLLGLILLIPITIFVFVLNKINKEKGPIFYNNYRIGKDGKKFKMYKFRTMCMNADEILEKKLAEDKEFKERYNKFKKLKDDPRITKCGKILRATSLDEFPQFINVLKGDMSLVGPRPYLPREKEDMGEYFSTIIKVKPGITGPWQVSGRSNLSFEDRMKLDTKYVAESSIKNELKIVWKTITKVIKKDGAV